MFPESVHNLAFNVSYVFGLWTILLNSATEFRKNLLGYDELQSPFLNAKERLKGKNDHKQGTVLNKTCKHCYGNKPVYAVLIFFKEMWISGISSFRWKCNSLSFYLGYAWGHTDDLFSNFPVWSSLPLSEGLELCFHVTIFFCTYNSRVTGIPTPDKLCCQTVFSFSCLFTSISSVFLDPDLLSL